MCQDLGVFRALEVMRTTGQLLAKARDKHYDCSNMVKKLRALVQTAEEQVGEESGLRAGPHSRQILSDSF